VDLGGELDIVSAVTAVSYVMDVIDRCGGPVIVDLAALTFCDARGLGVLLQMAGHAERAGCEFRLASPRPSVVKIMRITGLDRRFLASEASSDEGRGLAHGVVGSARVVAFGVSTVAPAGSVAAGLFILVSYAGFASPLVVVVAFVASLCCASSIAEFARRLGIATSSSADLLLAAGEVAVITALAITILVKTGPAHWSVAAFSPASSPHGQLSDITNGMIYGISAFAGFEAAAALGEEARHSRRSIPAATIVVVVVTGIFYLLVVLAETFGAGRGASPA
jgi:anti-anti-sigma factor